MPKTSRNGLRGQTLPGFVFERECKKWHLLALEKKLYEL